MSWTERDKKVVWHPFTQAQTAAEPMLIERAKDASYYDSEGRKYIDINSSWWVNVHGHGNKRIQEAIAKQFGEIDHVIFASATHKPGIELAEKVVDILPEQYSKVFFSDDGSTAVEVALKMAFQYWFNKNQPKKRILALEGAYHGDTFGAMAIGQRGFFNRPFEHFFFEVDFLSFPDGENNGEQLAQGEKLFATGEFAAVIVEPLIQGSAGMRIYDKEWLNTLLQIAREHGVLVILDEVMTGWGRTGKYFAHRHIQESGDIICLSKGLTGGVLPLGLTVTSDKVYDAFLHPETAKALLHGHSYTGNAIACAAALASMQIFEEEETWKNVDRISRRHADFLQQLAKYPIVQKAESLGTIVRFEMVLSDNTSYFSDLRNTIADHFLQAGVFLRPLGNIVFFNPPYCITDSELDQVYDATVSLIEKLSQ